MTAPSTIYRKVAKIAAMVFCFFELTEQARAIPVFTEAPIAEQTADAMTGAQVSAKVSGATYVWADMTQGKSRTRTFLNHSTGNDWWGILPPCHSGQATVVFSAEDAEGNVVSSDVRQTVTLTENTTDAKGMTEQRKPTIYLWKVSSAGNTFSEGGTDWTVRDAHKNGYDAPLRLKGATNEVESAVDLTKDPPGIGGYMRTSGFLTDGIGSVWFKARMANANVGSGRAAIDLLRYRRSGRNSYWTITQVAEFDIPERANTVIHDWNLFHFTLQKLPADANEFCFRIRNKTLEENDSDRDNFVHAICVMDVVITPPIPDVAVSRDELDYAPGFPNVRDPISFHVAVSNRWDAAPVTNITPRLVWRQNSGRTLGAWHETVMTNTLGRTEQGDGIYACTLQPGEFRAGEFEYFYDVSFGGYTPRFPVVFYPAYVPFSKLANEQFGWGDFDYLIHTNALGVLASADASGLTPAGSRGSINEGRSPAYSPSLTEVYGAGGTDAMTWDGSIVPGTPAADYVDWDYTSKFDPRELDDGWPTAPAVYFVHNGQTGGSSASSNATDVAAVAGTVEIPGTYGFLSFFSPDGIRNYRSANDGLALATAPWSGSGDSGLQGSYPMTLVGDYTWMAIVRVTNEIDVAVSPTSAWHHVAGETVYTRGPYVWLEQAQDESSVNPPSSGDVKPVRGTPASYNLAAATGFEEEALALDSSKLDATAPTRLSVNYDGHLMYRFCATNGAYEIRRATWQDFNGWVGDDSYFSRSYGLEDMKEWSSSLDGRIATTNAAMSTRGFQKDTPDPDDRAEPDSSSRFADGLVIRNAWVQRDETEVAINAAKTIWAPNQSVRLSTLATSPGSLETTYFTKSSGGGRGTFEFKVRSSARDTIAAYYEPGLSWSSDYTAYALVTNAVWSDATNAHVSVFSNWKNEDDNLEARLVQHVRYAAGAVGSTPDENLCRYLALELVRTVNGTETVLASVRYPENASDSEKGSAYTLGAGWVVALHQGGGTAEALLYPGAGFLGKTVSAAAAPVRRTGETAVSVSGGTVAVNAFEAAGHFSAWVVVQSDWVDETKFNGGARLYPGFSSGAAYAQVSYAGEGSWKQATGRYWNYREPWDGAIQGSSVTAPTTLVRPVPTAYYRVQVYRTGEEESMDVVAPVPTYTDDWDEHWDVVGSHDGDGIRSVTSFDWVPDRIDMKLWDDTFVRLVALAEDGAGEPSTAFLSVDEVGGRGWLGQTVYDPDTVDLENGWIGTYAVVSVLGRNNDGSNNGVWTLERSRANPGKPTQPPSGSSLPAAYTGLAQALLTPLLADGVGDISFEYRAAGADVVFDVELFNERTGAIVNDSDWRTMTVTARVSNAFTPFRQTFTRNGMSGRIRIRPVPDEASLSGILYLDNLRVTDYPASGDTSWEAYNALVSTFTTLPGDWASAVDGSTGERLMWSGATNELLKFDTQNADYRSAALNAAAAEYTANRYSFAEHAPCLQSPAIETGIGQIGFWYRWPDAENREDDTPGRIVLKVARNADVPDNEWKTLTWLDLNTNETQNASLAEERAALEALEEITNLDWNYFTAEFYLQDYNVLRVCAEGAGGWDGSETGAGRVLVDNVLLTEPVRTSIDVGTVEFDPGVPLCTAPTRATVSLVNPRQRPENVRVYLDWFAIGGGTVSLESTNRIVSVSERTVTTNFTTYVEGLGNIPVEYSYQVVETNSYMTIDATRVPPMLSSRWGYEKWKSVSSGTLLFTNRVGTYVFDSTNAIPTQSYPPDTVFQYCVRVEYEGRFAAPVYSETQGRVSGGFWFENPAWYEPIDLNELFGAPENKPVAHFWNFTVSTNQAFFNEIRPATQNVNNRNRQFVELIGAEGGSVAGWTIHHTRLDSLEHYPISSQYQWTNTLASGAAFQPDPNATTNKGWGFYVLGCSAVSKKNETLFPAAAETASDFWSQPNMYIRGGLMLKRGMGAYVDRVCWSERTQSEVQNLVDLGYTYIGSFRWNNNYVYAMQEARDDDAYVEWGTLSGSYVTPGSYNGGEEDAIWALSGLEEEEPVYPLIGQPTIVSFEMDEGNRTVSLSFTVSVTNGVPLAASDYSWKVELADDLSTPDDDWIPVTFAGLSTAEGETNAVGEVTLRLDAGYDVRFYRIRAEPANP